MEREKGDRAGGTAAGAPPLAPSTERAGGRGSQHRCPAAPAREGSPKQTPLGGPARPGWPALAAWPGGTERALLGELLRPGGDLAAGPAASECGAGRGGAGLDWGPPLTLMCFLTVSVRSRRSSSGIPISSQMSRSAAMARFRHDTASAANTSLRAPGPAGHQQPPDGARSPPRPPPPVPPLPPPSGPRHRSAPLPHGDRSAPRPPLAPPIQSATPEALSGCRRRLGPAHNRRSGRALSVKFFLPRPKPPASQWQREAFGVSNQSQARPAAPSGYA